MVAVVTANALAPLGQRLSGGNLVGPGDAVQVVAVEHRLVGQVRALCDPDGSAGRVSLITDALPGGHRQSRDVVKEDDGTALILKVGRVRSVNGEKVAEVVGVAVGAAHHRRIDVKIDRNPEALSPGYVEHGLQVLLCPVSFTPPIHDKGVDACATGLVDLTAHHCWVVRVVEILRQIGRSACVPRVGIEPGIVERENQPLLVSLYKITSRPREDREQKKGYCQ